MAAGGPAVPDACPVFPDRSPGVAAAGDRTAGRPPPAAGVRTAPRCRGDGRGRRDRLPPAAALAPLLRPGRRHRRAGVRRPAARGHLVGDRGRVGPDGRRAPPPGLRPGPVVGRGFAGRRGLPAVGRRRRPQGAAGAPGALRRRPHRLRHRLDRRRGAAAGRGRPAAHPRPIPRTVTLAVLGAAALGYLLAAQWTTWPVLRTLSWLLGVTVLGVALTGPAAHAHGDLQAHLAGHLLVGMVAPVLLVLAAPVTLALRTLPRSWARALARSLRSGPARLLGDPFLATALNVGGLWLMYRTPLADRVLHDPALHLPVSLHVLLTGWLATAAVLAVDPAPHRRGIGARAGALAAGMAAHDVVAKLLYSDPPAGAHDAASGARLMYDGGTVVHVVVAALLWRQWYRSRGAVRAAEQAAATA